MSDEQNIEIQRTKIEKRLNTLRQKALQPIKTKLLFRRNELFGIDNTENIIPMWYQYLLEEEKIEVPEKQKRIIDSVVEWWVTQIKKTIPETGDWMLDGFARLSQSQYEPVTDVNIEAFKSALTKIIADELNKNKSIDLGVYNHKSSYLLNLALYMANINREFCSQYLSMIVTTYDAIENKGYNNREYQSIINGKCRILTKEKLDKPHFRKH